MTSTCSAITCSWLPNPLEQEIYRALSVDPRAADFVGDVLGASSLVRLAAAVPAGRPAPTQEGVPGVRYAYSRATWQGDNTPTDYDLVGSREEGTGLFALEQVPWVDFICLVPGVSGATLGPVALFAADRYCRERHALLLLDPPFDPLVAILVALNILWEGGKLVRQSVGGLMDEANPELEKKIHAVLKEETSKKGLEYHHQLRYRESGISVWMEFHLLFPKGTLIEDAHALSTDIETALAKAIDQKTHIITHLEPIEDHDILHPEVLKH